MPEGGTLKTRLTGPALGLLAVCVILAFTMLPELRDLYRQIELRTLDYRFRTRPALEQSPLICHVDIDDSSISSFGRWPWPRTRHAQLLDILDELGAHTVVFDVEFSEASQPEDDNAFARALEETHFSIVPFLLPLKAEQTPEEARVEAAIRQLLAKHFDAGAEQITAELDVPRTVVDKQLMSFKKSVAQDVGWEMLQQEGRLTSTALRRRLLPEANEFFETVEKKIIPLAADHALAMQRVYQVSARPPDDFPPDAFVRADRITPPIHLLAQECVGFGASNTNPDAEDGVLRHISLFFRKDDRLLPHLSLSSACRLLGIDLADVEIVPGRHVVLKPQRDVAGSTDPIVIPIDDRCRTIVNWAGRRDTAWNEIFTHVPYGSFLELHVLRENIQANDAVLDRIFQDNDQFIGGDWSKAVNALGVLRQRKTLTDETRAKMDVLAKQQVDAEAQIINKLQRTIASISEEELKKLPEDDEDRKLIAQMRRYIEGIRWLREEKKRLTADVRDLHAKLEEAVRGRLCIVGMTATASTDLKPTPISPVFPGVGAHSAVINSILQRSFVREAPGWVNVLIIVIVGLGVSATANYLGTRGATLGTVAVLIGWVAAAWVLFWLWGYWVTVAGPVMAGFLAYAAITAYRQLTEERQKRFIRNAFQFYLSPAVVAEVLKNPDALKLGGERKELTVFFSDIAGFTPISERMESEDLVILLNDYLSEMSEVILDANGYINKYQGDGIMAVFGAPLPDDAHAEAACRVALESQHRLRDFREKLMAEKRPIIRARIGINSGVMLLGNMGSRKRLDYTVMGDNVNVAARLESAGKHFGTEIIIGEDTWRRVEGLFEARRLGMVNVKGRTKPVGAYELLAEKGKCPPLVAKLLPHYEAGLEAYAHQHWDDAIAAFGECLKINPQDGPSRAYLNRCHLLKRETAEEQEHWDGTFPLETK